MTINAPNVIADNGISMATPAITPTYVAQPGPVPERIIVACVCHGKKYSDMYVQRLKLMVSRWLSAHEFVCLSDRQIEGVNTIPLHDIGPVKEGWWYKVQLFAPNMFPDGAKVLYLDLDLVVTNHLDTLAGLRTDMPLTMVYNFGPNRRHCAHNSSVMLWTAGDPRVEAIYELWTLDVATHLHGDQCWIWRVLRDKIANFPRETIQSYKYDVRPNRNIPSADARVVVFHGDPKPEDCKHLPFIQENWI